MAGAFLLLSMTIGSGYGIIFGTALQKKEKDVNNTKICPICDKSYAPYGNQKYCCEECSKEARRRQALEYKRRGYRKKAPTRKRAVPAPVKVRVNSLDSLSGEQLLHYGALQQAMNAELLKVEIPRGPRHE